MRFVNPNRTYRAIHTLIIIPMIIRLFSLNNTPKGRKFIFFCFFFCQIVPKAEGTPFGCLYCIPVTKNPTIMTRKQILKIILSVLIAALTALGAGFGLTSCNVTRTITTQSQYYQRGDTTCTIVTKTIETYDATKKL